MTPPLPPSNFANLISKEEPTIQESFTLVYYTHFSLSKSENKSIISHGVGRVLIVLSLGKAMRRPDGGVRLL